MIANQHSYAVETLGFAAGALIAASFVPQNLKIIRTRDTASISRTMYSVYTFACALWLVYGVLIGSAAMVFWNGVTMALAGYILFLKIRYG